MVVSKANLYVNLSPVNLRRPNGGPLCCGEGASYLQVGWVSLRKPNSAPRLNGGGKLSCGWKLAEMAMRRFEALLLASNGPGTWLPWRFWCGHELRKNRLTAWDNCSSEIQMCCAAGE